MECNYVLEYIRGFYSWGLMFIFGTRTDKFGGGSEDVGPEDEFLDAVN